MLAGLILGTALNLADVPMADIWFTILKITVFLGTILAMFAMGSRMRFSRLGKYHRRLSWIYLVKFAAHPIAMLALCWIFGLTGLPAGVLLIASCMPVGVNVVGFSTIYDLDVDLANAGYLWTTAIFMTVVLPLLILALQAPIFH